MHVADSAPLINTEPRTLPRRGQRQFDTQALVIAAFEHRMSRDQDPNVHTHAIVANRVLCADGEWAHGGRSRLDALRRLSLSKAL
ncbi:MAG: hypothetical protein DLM57_10360 [Pseudonocardiales bacterium]|nr:MAG: hypothetical protein DLM57_10360 [Pseudonocardiales bacterium]